MTENSEPGPAAGPGMETAPEVVPVQQFHMASYQPAVMERDENGEVGLGIMLSDGGGNKLILKMDLSRAGFLGEELSRKATDAEKAGQILGLGEGIQDRLRDRR